MKNIYMNKLRIIKKSQTVSVFVLVVQLLTRKRNVNLLNRKELESWLLRWHTIKNITQKIYTYCLNENNAQK